MNLLELIQSVVDKVRWLVRDDEFASKIAEAPDGINISASIEPNGEFELIGLIFINQANELWVDTQGIDYVGQTNHPGSRWTQFDEFDFRYTKELFAYDGWDGLLLYGMEE